LDCQLQTPHLLILAEGFGIIAKKTDLLPELQLQKMTLNRDLTDAQSLA
jgi:ATP-dependent protease HslVU (ClpYQ) ATPase subunit